MGDELKILYPYVYFLLFLLAVLSVTLINLLIEKSKYGETPIGQRILPWFFDDVLGPIFAIYGSSLLFIKNFKRNLKAIFFLSFLFLTYGIKDILDMHWIGPTELKMDTPFFSIFFKFSFVILLAIGLLLSEKYFTKRAKKIAMLMFLTFLAAHILLLPYEFHGYLFDLLEESLEAFGCALFLLIAFEKNNLSNLRVHF